MKVKHKELTMVDFDNEKDVGELTDDQASYHYRATALVYFSQYVDAEMLGYTDDDDYSQRQLTKELKQYARTLTPNKITGFEPDGWTLHFKEVVEAEFDYYPHFPLRDQTDLWGVKPHHLPDGWDGKSPDVTYIKLKK